MSLWQRLMAWFRGWRRQPQRPMPAPQRPAQPAPQAQAQPGQVAQQPAQQAQPAGKKEPGWLAKNTEFLFTVLLSMASLALIVGCVGVMVTVVLWVLGGIGSTYNKFAQWAESPPASMAQQAPQPPQPEESSLSAGEVQSWMSHYLSDEQAGWHQLKLVHQHHMVGREGWEPLPINLAFMDGGLVVLRPQYGASGLGVDYFAGVHSQLQPDLEVLSIRGGRAVIRSDGGPLAAHLTPRWNLRGPFNVAFEVEVLPPKTQRLWIGRYCVLPAKVVSYFGYLPFAIKNEPVNWTMQVHFLPADTDGDGLLPFPHLRADYYTTRWHEVVLGTGDLWEAATWKEAAEDPKAVAALSHMQLRQDSWHLSSHELRESFPNAALPDKAWLGFQVHEPLVVQVVVLF